MASDAVLRALTLAMGALAAVAEEAPADFGFEPREGALTLLNVAAIAVEDEDR